MEEIARITENFAPLNLAEPWDCSGWIVKSGNKKARKAMLCLTVIDDVYNQAKALNCDIIISHHPLFFVPLKYRDINIYCAHTNMDCAKGGTTDVLIKHLGLKGYGQGFLRYVDYRVTVGEFAEKLSTISPNMRYVNNLGRKVINKIAFCAGSGSEFIEEAVNNGAEAFVTGDLKFHTAVESKIVLFDIGHFESEIFVLKVFENILKDYVEIVYAKEKSPFISPF